MFTSYIDLTLVTRLLHSNFVFRFLGKSFTRKGRRSREPLPEELRWVVDVVRIWSAGMVGRYGRQGWSAGERSGSL